MNAVCTPSSGCRHKAVLATPGIDQNSGIVAWDIRLEQTADCYSATGICGENFDFSSGDAIVGIAPNSWGLGFYPGSHVSNSPNRIQANSRLNQGQVVRSIYDSDEGTLVQKVDGVERARYTGINLEVAYIILTVCELSNGGYTLVPVEDVDE